MTMAAATLKLEAFAATPLVREPFEHLVVKDFLQRDALDGARQDFPAVPSAGSHPPAGLKIEGAFKRLVDDIYSDEVATDSAPRVTAVQSQPVFAGVNATNTTGAHLLLSGTPGAINITGVTKANTTGDTIAFAYTLADGTSATVTLTGGAKIQSDAGTLSLSSITGNYNLSFDGVGSTMVVGTIATGPGTLTKLALVYEKSPSWAALQCSSESSRRRTRRSASARTVEPVIAR
jgi:hypothetical protein